MGQEFATLVPFLFKSKYICAIFIDMKIIITEDQYKMIIESDNSNLMEVLPNKYVYHTSNPVFRDKITEEGIRIKGKSETWLSNTNIDGDVIFAVNSDDKKKWWDSTYDDDIYRINTSNLTNKWYNDPNFKIDDKRIITFENIPLNAIKIIYKGTGLDIIDNVKR